MLAESGRVHRLDYEYRRNGTANLFVFVDANRSWRHVKVTEQRPALDFAECLRDLVDVHYPEVKVIRVVLDMVEIELSILSRQCLRRRIPDLVTLRREVAAWKRQRDATGARITWLFDIDEARRKLGATCPEHTQPTSQRAA